MHSFTKSIEIIFDTFCLVASVCTISYCIYKYNLDEDSTSVDFKSFDKYNHVQGYPSFTICLLEPFLKNKLESQGDGIDIASYTSASFGNEWDSRINKVTGNRKITLQSTHNPVFS